MVILNELNWEQLKDSHVLMIDDICDTGKTLKLLADELLKKGAQSVESAVLVLRPDKKHDIEPNFYGLTCSGFIVGFGLDYNLEGRQYPVIYQKLQE